MANHTEADRRYFLARHWLKTKTVKEIRSILIETRKKSAAFADDMALWLNIERGRLNMASPEQLLAMMTPKGVSFVGGGGGVPALTGLDVAAALGMGRLDRLAYLLVLFKFCGDESVRPDLTILINAEIVSLFESLNWDSPFGDADTGLLLENLGQMALADVMGVRCKKCNGTAYIAAKPCRSCSGSGNHSPSGRQRAARLGLNESNWRRRWSDRYKVIVNKLECAVSRGLYHVIKHVEENQKN